MGAGSSMGTIEAFAREAQDPAYWRRLAPWMHLEAGEGSAPAPPAPVEAQPGGEDWTSRGFLRLRQVLEPPLSGALARAATALHEARVHPTFLLVYDEAWTALQALRPRLAAALGGDFDLLGDLWAFFVDPRVDRGGWPIHRGWYEDVRDASGRPTLVNVWIALTEATARNACIHAVPLPVDPHFPRALKALDGLAPLGLPLPIDAGDALLWSANVAHWGGDCDPSFDRPRVSLSVSARRGGGAGGDVPVLCGAPGLRARLDLIAAQIGVYGARDLPAEGPEMRWAAMVNAMGAIRRGPSRGG